MLPFKRFAEFVTIENKYTNMDLLGYLKQTGAYRNSSSENSNGDIAYYVDCPNINAHNTHSPTESMVFEKENRSPNFHCNHSQCSHITFDDFIIHYQSNTCNINDFLDEESQIPDEVNDVPLEENITFHGYTTLENNHVFSSNDSTMIISLKPTELTEMNLFNLLSNERIWLGSFKLYKNGKCVGIDWKKAAKYLISRSKAAGPYKASSIKSLGIHVEEDGEFLFNNGRYVIDIDGNKYNYHQIKEKYPKSLYIPADRDVEVLPKLLSHSKVMEWVDLIKQLPFASEYDFMKFLSVVVCGMISGGIKHRPYGWINGGPGQGKSDIQSIVIRPMWIVAGGQFCKENTTSAGIEQGLNGMNVPISYDEAEPKNKKAVSRIEQVLDSSKSSATNNPAETLKGSRGGISKNYNHKSCYMYSSVANSINDATLERRVVIILLKLERRHKENWPTLNEKILSFKKDYFQKLFWTLFSNIKVFNNLYDIIKKVMHEKTTAPSEVIPIWTAILSAWMFINNLEPSENNIMLNIEKYVINHISINRTESENNNAVYVVEEILNLRLRNSNNQNLIVEDLIKVVCDKNSKCDVPFTGNKAHDLLKKHGIRLNKSKTVLYIHSKHSFLSKYFNEKIGNYASVLMSYPGAKKTTEQIRFGALRNRCISIPINNEWLEKDDE